MMCSMNKSYISFIPYLHHLCQPIDNIPLIFLYIKENPKNPKNNAILKTMLIQILLALYIILFLLSILSLVIRVKKTTGVFPIIQNKPGVYGFVDRLVTIAYVLVIANAITFITNYAPISVFNPLITLETMLLQYIGTALIGIALSLMYLAQLQMKESWRIGVDTQNEIELINKGLFRYFRHPIYFFATIDRNRNGTRHTNRHKHIHIHNPLHCTFNTITSRRRIYDTKIRRSIQNIPKNPQKIFLKEIYIERC